MFNNLSNVTDAQLLLRVAGGDQKRLTSFIGRHHRSLTATALANSLSRADSEEVVGEAFVKVWRSSAEHMHHGIEPKYWLRSLMHQALKEKFQTVKKTPVDGFSATGLADSESPIKVQKEDILATLLPHQLEAEQRRACFDVGLEALSVAHCKVLELALLAGQADTEIAREISQPLDAVKSLKYTAIKKIQGYVGECLSGSHRANHSGHATQQLLSLDRSTGDDLIALSAGTLDQCDLKRVTNLVCKDLSLLQALSELESIRESLVRSYCPIGSAVAMASTTSWVLEQIAELPDTSVELEKQSAWRPDWTAPVTTAWHWVLAPERPNWAYGIVLAQVLVLAVLAVLTLPWQAEEFGSNRSGLTAVNSKQSGAMLKKSLLIVNFSSNTTESSLRALLLEIQAEIVSGPNLLGQYLLNVARNQKDFAKRRLSESELVERISETER